jgi:hypothetical protein
VRVSTPTNTEHERELARCVWTLRFVLSVLLCLLYDGGLLIWGVGGGLERPGRGVECLRHVKGGFGNNWLTGMEL